MKKHAKKVVSGVIDEVDTQISGIATETDKLVDPYRKSVLRRFPVLFLFLVTFGFTATLVGLEKVIEAIPLLSERPVLILLLGVVILALTGKLYQKLG